MPKTWRAWLSPTFTSTTPVASATSPVPFPRRRCTCTTNGARHLVDPSRLVRSAALVYGPLLDTLFGRLDATPAERVHVLGDGEEIDLGGGRLLRAIDSPGHAKHHLGLMDSATGLLFAGDAVGVRLPEGGVLRPATPPPDFDLEAALASLRRFASGSERDRAGPLRPCARRPPRAPRRRRVDFESLGRGSRTSLARRRGHSRGPGGALCSKHRRLLGGKTASHRHAGGRPLQRRGATSVVRTSSRTSCALSA